MNIGSSLPVRFAIPFSSLSILESLLRSEPILFAQLDLRIDTGVDVFIVLAVEGEGVNVPSFVSKSDSKRVVLIETYSLKLK